MITGVQPDVRPRCWYSVPDVVGLLRLSRSSVYNYMSSGELKFRWSDDNKHRFVRGDELLRFWKTKVVSRL